LYDTLDRYYLDTLDDNLISLSDFVRQIPQHTIQMINPYQRLPISQLLSDEEISFIQDVYLRKLSKIYKKFIGQGIERIND
jgi:hypothetical protein